MTGFEKGLDLKVALLAISIALLCNSPLYASALRVPSGYHERHKKVLESNKASIEKRLLELNTAYPGDRFIEILKKKSKHEKTNVIKRLKVFNIEKPDIKVVPAKGIFIAQDDLMFCDVIQELISAGGLVINKDVRDNDVIGSAITFEGCIACIVEDERKGKTVIAYGHLGTLENDCLEKILAEIDKLRFKNPRIIFDILEEGLSGDRDKIESMIGLATPKNYPTLYKARKKNNILINESGGMSRNTSIIAAKEGIVITDISGVSKSILFAEIKNFVNNKVQARWFLVGAYSAVSTAYEPSKEKNEIQHLLSLARGAIKVSTKFDPGHTLKDVGLYNISIDSCLFNIVMAHVELLGDFETAFELAKLIRHADEYQVVWQRLIPKALGQDIPIKKVLNHYISGLKFQFPEWHLPILEEIISACKEQGVWNKKIEKKINIVFKALEGHLSGRIGDTSRLWSEIERVKTMFTGL